MTTDLLHDLLAQRILLLDGAMGTMIQRHTLTEADFRGERFRRHPHDLKGNGDVLALTRPDVISGIHREYLAAGADILETNTFDQVRAAYRDQARGLIDGGADLLLIETIFDTLNAKAAIAAVLDTFDERGVELPLMISATITDRSGRVLSGQTLDAFYVSIRHARPFSVGLNCALGAEQMRPYLAELARIAECYVTSYPNAGLQNAFGEYDELPPDTATLLRDFAQSGFVNILGGCCGTTPDHIRAVARAVQASKPRPLPGRLKPPTDNGERPTANVRFTQFSGLETLTIRPDSNFIMI